MYAVRNLKSGFGKSSLSFLSLSLSLRTKVREKEARLRKRGRERARRKKCFLTGITFQKQLKNVTVRFLRIKKLSIH